MPAQMFAPDRRHVWFTEVALDVEDAPPSCYTYWTEGPAISADSAEEAVQYVRSYIDRWPWPLGDGSELGKVTDVRVYRGAFGNRITIEDAS